MAKITLHGNPVNTLGDLPKVGTSAPDFSLLKQDLSTVSLKDFSGKKKVLNIFPSIDTPVCATSVRKFTQEALGNKDVVVLHISQDLPFAQKRFCGAEGLENALTLSGFQSQFGRDYKVEMTDSPLKGLYSRAVVVLDANNQVLFCEQVPEIAQEPNYQRALAVLT